MAEEQTNLIEKNLATKRDIKELEVALRNEMKALEERMSVRLLEVKAEILKWMFGALLAQAALVATLVKLL